MLVLWPIENEEGGANEQALIGDGPSETHEVAVEMATRADEEGPAPSPIPSVSTKLKEAVPRVSPPARDLEQLRWVAAKELAPQLKRVTEEEDLFSTRRRPPAPTLRPLMNTSTGGPLSRGTSQLAIRGESGNPLSHLDRHRAQTVFPKKDTSIAFDDY